MQNLIRFINYYNESVKDDIYYLFLSFFNQKTITKDSSYWYEDSDAEYIKIDEYNWNKGIIRRKRGYNGEEKIEYITKEIFVNKFKKIKDIIINNFPDLDSNSYEFYMIFAYLYVNDKLPNITDIENFIFIVSKYNIRDFKIPIEKLNDVKNILKNYPKSIDEIKIDYELINPDNRINVEITDVEIFGLYYTYMNDIIKMKINIKICFKVFNNKKSETITIITDLTKVKNKEYVYSLKNYFHQTDFFPKYEFIPFTNKNGTYIYTTGKFVILPKKLYKEAVENSYSDCYGNRYWSFGLLIDRDLLIEKENCYIVTRESFLKIGDIKLKLKLDF